MRTCNILIPPDIVSSEHQLCGEPTLILRYAHCVVMDQDEIAKLHWIIQNSPSRTTLRVEEHSTRLLKGVEHKKLGSVQQFNGE